jgi:predicted ATPase
MCDVFQLGKQIRVETSKGNRYLYTVSLTGRDGIKVPITHVGFGVSQIFPILVEGLRPGPDGRLVILEQPEIHLHPRVQSLLFDFVYSVSSNVSFLIETHSDHLITRLRRRIAESHSDEIVHNLNLTFVEPVIGGVDYVRLGISDTGSLARWPDGFFDQYDADMRALVRAQANKRIAKRN